MGLKHLLLLKALVLNILFVGVIDGAPEAYYIDQHLANMNKANKPVNIYLSTYEKKLNPPDLNNLRTNRSYLLKKHEKVTKCVLLHGIDATKLHEEIYPELNGTTFDEVIWIGPECKNPELRDKRGRPKDITVDVVRSFAQNTSKVMNGDTPCRVIQAMTSPDFRGIMLIEGACFLGSCTIPGRQATNRKKGSLGERVDHVISFACENIEHGSLPAGMRDAANNAMAAIAEEYLDMRKEHKEQRKKEGKEPKKLQNFKAIFNQLGEHLVRGTTDDNDSEKPKPENVLTHVRSNLFNPNEAQITGMHYPHPVTPRSHWYLRCSQFIKAMLGFKGNLKKMLIISRGKRQGMADRYLLRESFSALALALTHYLPEETLLLEDLSDFFTIINLSSKPLYLFHKKIFS